MIRLDDIRKRKPDEWYLEHAPARHLFISGIVRGFVDGLKLREYSVILGYYRKGEMDWCTLIEDQDRIAELIFREHEKDRGFWKREFERWIEAKKRVEENFKAMKEKDISKVPDEELAEDMKHYIGLQYAARKVSDLIDPFIFSAERKLSGLLEGIAKADPDINIQEAFGILIKHESPSFVNIAGLELIRIAKAIAKDMDMKERFCSGALREGDIAGTDVHGRIRIHLGRFPWLKAESFFGAREYTFDDAARHLKDLLGSSLEEEERKNRLWEDNRKIRNDYMSKHAFKGRILTIAELSPIFAEWQDMRKENTLMTTCLNSKYLREMSKRTGIGEDELAYLDYSEISSVIIGKFDVSCLKKRKEGCLFVFKKEGFRVFYGDDAEEVIGRILHHEENEDELSGMCASPGRAEGMVKIVIKQDDVPKVDEGDILVSTMTRPEHTAAMRKAAAIVTNEGGITCHAAIISREMKKPCIIGTKTATKVLKDGDLVEVDADKGVVRRIRKV